MAHVVLAITLVVSVVFAHGGACAAVELSEGPAHSAHLPGADRAHAEHDARCLHRELPARHRHGTEADCSVTSPAGAPAPVALPASASLSPARPAGEAPYARADLDCLSAPHLADLCVMRI
ncbi:hypothetical protein [Nonomuraea sp. B1E8]|uniref:hypothetical protein n=1 Tax=unclassified Nonomuraea TaxID=2593643 RepID=UPI00325CE1CD